MTSSIGSVAVPLVWQQIVALDAKYNPHRNFENMLYIKRRNQLLREKLGKDSENVVAFRKQYIRIRSQLLSQRYGRNIDTRSTRSWNGEESLKGPAPQLCDLPESVLSSLSLDDIQHPCEPAEASQDFSGMHHVFDQHKSAVTAVRFATNDNSLLACSSLDGTLSICQIMPPPATLLYILSGHEAGVRDFQWSISNDILVSCSLDCTIRLWDAASGSCVRIIRDPTESPILTCSYQPSNNNMVIIGNERGFLHVLNISTGMPVKGGSLRTNANGGVQCMTFDCNGQIIWVGDNKGFISSFSIDITSGRLSRLTRTLIHPSSSITCLSSRSFLKADRQNNFLLVNCSPNTLLLFEVRTDKQLITKSRFVIRHQNKSMIIRNSFCPLMSTDNSVCIASGSEDGSIYFFRSQTNCESSQKCISSLQGHAAAVLDVCLNFDESLLASADEIGNVIVWKKASSLSG